MDISTAFSPGEACRDLIIGAIKNSNESLDICVFTISDDRISSVIKNAYDRGIEIRIISDNDKSFDLGSDIKDLSDEGLDVKIDKTEFHMHHKFMIIDGVATLTGSYNWTRSALLNNEENVVLINDITTANKFKDVFNNLWDKCEPIAS